MYITISIMRVSLYKIGLKIYRNYSINFKLKRTVDISGHAETRLNYVLVITSDSFYVKKKEKKNHENLQKT